MVTGFALTEQKMNPVLADTWSTKNKAVVMEGNYPNLAPYHTTIKPNHIKASPLVSWHMFNKNMLFFAWGQTGFGLAVLHRAPDTQRRDELPDMTTGRDTTVQEL